MATDAFIGADGPPGVATGEVGVFPIIPEEAETPTSPNTTFEDALAAADGTF